jgi:Tol biopolymer transport system component
MRRAVISLTAVVVAAATLTVASPATAGLSAVGPRIAYVSGGDGLFEIYSAVSDGSDIDNLTQAPDAVDVDPAWSPGAATQIAFARQGKNDETFRLWTMDADGDNKDELALAAKGGSSDRQPAWSSTGSQIVFTRQSRGNDTSHIYVVDVSGGPATQLTSTPAPGYDAAPVWEPGGSRIAFVSDRAGGIPQIFTMDSSGGSQVQVTTDSCFAANPSWHPTSDVLAFERLCPGSPTGWDIATIDLTNLSAGITSMANTTEDEHQPSWSPAGGEIIYTRYGADGDKDLWRSTGSVDNPVASVDQSAVEMSPDWGNNTTARADSLSTVQRTEVGERRDTAAPGGKGNEGKKGKKKRFRVSPGVKYRRFRKGRSDAFLLTVNPDQQATIDVALSNDRLPGHEKTKRMAKRHGAVAAINGDFGTPSGRPSHTFAEDGLLHQLSFAAAWNFAISRDEQRTFVDRPFERVTADEATSPDLWRVERWNFGEPAYNDISAFTAAGGTLETPPSNACAARLTPVAGPRWAPGMTGVETPYTVAATACSTSPMALDGGIVLAAQPGSDGGLLLDSLVIGETIDITWSLGWDGVADTVGGTPLLVEDGENAVNNCNGSICGRNPRTAIGVTAAGKILMLVIDGRSNRSAGVTMSKLSKIMRGLRAVFALNLDGGGSSTMVVRGKVMNRPSDGRQRRVSSAVLVLNGPDAEESIGDPAPRLIGPAIGGISTEDAEAALMDPASTGGLLEALAEGTFGPKVDLPPELDRALRRFRRGT